MTSSPPAALQLLKLGGSLITVKTQPSTPRLPLLKQLAAEIAAAWREAGHMPLIIGHGSGSFGHMAATRYNTRQGVRQAEEWSGFVEVWRQANALHRLVMDALAEAGLPVLSFPPSATIVAEEGEIVAWELAPIQQALAAGLLPVIYGDVVFDRRRGGTILSTEDLFGYLVGTLRPRRILLAGQEAGVWQDYPACTRLLTVITPQDLPKLESILGASAAPDVTGGMASKVMQSLRWVEQVTDLQVLIFSAEQPGSLRAALLGMTPGILLRRA